MNDSTVINSSSPFNLNAGEDIRVYVKHNYTAVGSYNVTARAYDSINNYTTTLAVKTNTSPVISLPPNVTFYEDGHNATIDLDDYVSDEDADADLTWTAVGNSSTTVRIEILDDHMINISGTQDYYNYPHGINITFIVTDTDGLSDNDTILVIVILQNDPPTIDWYTPDNNVTQFVPTNGQLQFDHTSTDADGDTLYYNWTLNNVEQATTQAWLYQPTINDDGDHVVNLTVTDTNLSTSLRWNVTVYVTYCNGNYNATMSQWLINSDVKCENETIPLTANITVQNNGNLTFRNITLQVNNSFNGEYEIIVQSGGQINIYDLDSDKSTTNDMSIIERGGAFGYTIIVDNGAVLEMRNSKLSGAGWNSGNRGLEISADNSIIQNNNITDNYNGLTILSDNNLIENNDFTENSNYGIYVNGLNNNISSNIVKVSGGNEGIFAEDIASDLLIDNNVITGPSANNKACIEFDSVNQSNITLNNITDCDYGVSFQGSSYNIITNNNISNNKDRGIYLIDSINNKILNTVISGNIDDSIVFKNSADNNIIQDSTISNSGDKDILYDGVSGNNTLINTTFDISNVGSDGGNLTVKWYLDVYVNDSDGNAVNNAVVKAYDKNNNLEFTETTDSSGNIEQQIVEEFSFLPDPPPPTNFKLEFKTNYTITASNISHEAETSVNLTESKAITLTLEIIPLNVYNLSVLNDSGLNQTFEFLITNQLTVNLNNVSWQFDTKDNNIINSTENIILTPDETIFTYIEYNFSSSNATYNVNATAINGTLTDSEDISVIIT
jgi:parallel beta-helix repeat protein